MIPKAPFCCCAALRPQLSLVESTVEDYRFTLPQWLANKKCVGRNKDWYLALAEDVTRLCAS